MSHLANVEVEQFYQELRRIAAIHLARENGPHTLQTTALVHEVYLRLRADRPAIADESHFLALASRMMRRVLIDYARAKNSRVRNERTAIQLPASGFQPVGEALQPEQLLSVNRAIEELEAVDELQGRIVEMRFFGGLSISEIAANTGASERTVEREWASARAWLLTRLDRSTAAVPD